MSAARRGAYAKRHASSNTTAVLKWLAGVGVLACLSFVFGFFILARVLPNAANAEKTPAPSSTTALTAANEEPARPRRTVVPPKENPPTRPKNDGKPTPATETGKPAEESSGPTLEPTDTVQEPKALDQLRNGEDPGTVSAEHRKREDKADKADENRRQDEAAARPEPSVQNPNAIDKTSTDKPTKKGRFRVQVGVFSVRETADEEAQKLSVAGLDARVIPYESDGRTLYRVQHGAYRNRANAEAALKKVTEAGIMDAIIVNGP